MKNNPPMRIPYNRCPLCASSNLLKSVVGDCSNRPQYNPAIPRVMQWMDCNDCKHQFIDGYFSDEALELIFKKTLDNQKVGYKIEEQRQVSARIIDRVVSYKSSGIWLDVGFGNGSLLFTAQEFGFETIGIDLRKNGVEAMKRLGFEAYYQLVETINFEKKISVLSLMDVLEHIPYPKEVLISLYDKMESGGCLLISMPNTENILWRLMTDQGVNPYLGELEHYHNFSRSRLYSLLLECGFEAVRYGISERYRVCMEVIALRS